MRFITNHHFYTKKSSTRSDKQSFPFDVFVKILSQIKRLELIVITLYTFV